MNRVPPHVVPWLCCGVLVVATAVAYAPSFSGQFVFDDLIQIVQNRNLHSLQSFIPWVARENRPVAFVTIWANYQLGGLNVAGYHLVNLAVHLAAGLLLFGLIRRTLRLPPLDGRFGERADVIAMVASLLWLIHPLQTQSVTYIIQRCESMMGMFYLLTFYCTLRGSQSSRAWPWYVGGVAAGWLGMGCKEVMITAPVLLVLFDRIFLARSWVEVIRRRWAYYLAYLPAMAWVVVITKFRAGLELVDGMEPPPTALEYFRSQPAVLLHYLRLVLVPDKLCFDYRWQVVEHWSDALLPGLAMVGLFAATVLALVFRPRLGFLGLACFVILAPTSSFSPIDDLAVEHRMYLPLAALVMLAVLAFLAASRRLTPRQRAVLGTLAVLLLAGMYATRTFVRNQVYSRPAALWANAMKQAPTNARACNNFACCALAGGQVDQALELFRQAIEINPAFDLSYCNVGRILDRRKQYAEAIAVLRQGVQNAPPSAMIHCGLAEMLEKTGDVAGATAEYRRALTIDPRHGRSQYKLGRRLWLDGKAEEAIGHFEAALKERPSDVPCNFRLALAYQRGGRFDEAIEYYQRALKADPRLELARRNVELCQERNPRGLPPSDEQGNGPGNAAQPVPRDAAGSPTSAADPAAHVPSDAQVRR